MKTVFRTVRKAFCSREIFAEKQSRVLQCINSGEYKDALDLSEELVENMRNWKDEKRMLNAMSNMGYIYKVTGELEKAEQIYKDVLSKLENTDDAMIVKQNLVTLYCEKKDFASAKQIYEELEPNFASLPENVVVFMYNTASS